MNEIKDGIYGYVAGTVSKVWNRDGRQAVVIDVQDRMKEYPDQVTAWNVTEQVQESDKVKFKGWLSFKEKTNDSGKTFFNVSMNKPVLIERQAQAGFASIGDEAPF